MTNKMLDEMKEKIAANLPRLIAVNRIPSSKLVGRKSKWIVDQILSLETDTCQLVVARRDAKVPQRRKYNRTALNAHDLPSEIYLQGQIDAQEDMVNAGWVQKVTDE